MRAGIVVGLKAVAASCRMMPCGGKVHGCSLTKSRGACIGLSCIREQRRVWHVGKGIYAPRPGRPSPRQPGASERAFQSIQCGSSFAPPGGGERQVGFKQGCNGMTLLTKVSSARAGAMCF